MKTDVEVAPLTLKVNPLPVVFIDNEYLLCVNTNGTEIIPPLEIDTGLENSAYTFIWSNLNGEIVGTESSFFPSQEVIISLKYLILHSILSVLHQ